MSTEPAMDQMWSNILTVLIVVASVGITTFVVTILTHCCIDRIATSKRSKRKRTRSLWDSSDSDSSISVCRGHHRVRNRYWCKYLERANNNNINSRHHKKHCCKKELIEKKKSLMQRIPSGNLQLPPPVTADQDSGTFRRLGLDRSCEPCLETFYRQLENQNLSPVQNTSTNPLFNNNNGEPKTEGGFGSYVEIPPKLSKNSVVFYRPPNPSPRMSGNALERRARESSPEFSSPIQSVSQQIPNNIFGSDASAFTSQNSSAANTGVETSHGVMVHRDGSQPISKDTSESRHLESQIASTSDIQNSKKEDLLLSSKNLLTDPIWTKPGRTGPPPRSYSVLSVEEQLPFESSPRSNHSNTNIHGTADSVDKTRSNDVCLAMATSEHEIIDRSGLPCTHMTISSTKSQIIQTLGNNSRVRRSDETRITFECDPNPGNRNADGNIHKLWSGELWNSAPPNVMTFPQKCNQCGQVFNDTACEPWPMSEILTKLKRFSSVYIKSGSGLTTSQEKIAKEDLIQWQTLFTKIPKK